MCYIACCTELVGGFTGVPIEWGFPIMHAVPTQRNKIASGQWLPLAIATSVQCGCQGKDMGWQMTAAENAALPGTGYLVADVIWWLWVQMG